MIGSRRAHSCAMPAYKQHPRRGFTLVELLMVMALIGMLSSAMLVALYAAGQTAKVRRTEQQVQRIHSLLMSRWESYQYRPLPFRTNGSADQRAWQRLVAMRELMRLELPDRLSDVSDYPVDVRLENNVIWKQYRRRAETTWTTQHQSAECLYLILGSIREGDRTGLDFFTEDEIGDTDDDKMNEILDGWGKPIAFLRWAPGFSIAPRRDGKWGNLQSHLISERGNGGDDQSVSNLQIPFGNKYPDPFDPLTRDTRNTFALFPLVFSAGPDGDYDIAVEEPSGLPPSAQMTPANDPFYVMGAIPENTGTVQPQMQIGTPWDNDNPKDGDNSLDNITNH